MIRIRIRSASSIAIAAMSGLVLNPATAGVVFSENFEAPVVTGYSEGAIPNNGKWIGANQGFGAGRRGLYNEIFSWPATAAFTTPNGYQAYYLNYSNSGLTTSVGATGQTLTADVTYKVSFNAAVASGTTSGTYLVQLVAFAPADDNNVRKDCRGTGPGTVLASATGTVTTTDMSTAGSLTFTPNAANAHLGKDLAVRLMKSTNSVLYDNIRLVTGHDMLPSPASGVHLPVGNTVLSWTNMPPNTPGGDVPVDIWFGTNPAALTQVVDGVLTSTTTVNAPSAGTYYWRVDSYPDGNTTGAPVTGDLFFFVVTDSDSDGLPDTYELANTNPASGTALDPASNLDSDGLTAAQEYFYGTNPNDNDTDNDTLIDGPELTGVGLRPATSPVDADSDNDALSDGVESNTGTWVGAADTGTNPADADWDNDGINDGDETNTGTYVDRLDTGSNPFLADTDSDGALDWYEATATFTDPNSNTQTPNVPYPLPDPVSTDLGAINKPVKVYIMAGQSNTVGIGQVNGTALGTLETITKRENKFPNLIDGSNNWTKRNDVIYKGVVSATAAGPLTAGQGAGSTQLGPELGFGQIMGWYHDEPVLILKASQGNRSLGWDFLPPGSERWIAADKTYAGYGDTPKNWLTATGAPSALTWYAGKQYDDCFRAESQMGMVAWATGSSYVNGVIIRHNGAAYTSKSAHTADASSEPGIGASWATYWTVYSTFNVYDVLGTGVLQNLPTTGNNLNGRTYEIAGFCWWQGHKDQDGSGNIYATRYETNLVKLITALRADFNAPNAPFVVATIGFGGEPLSNKETDFQQVYNAQMAVGNPALHPEFTGTVKSVDILKYWREVAESPTNQDYHYNQSAETYMLVGDAMGRAMLEMQNDVLPPSPNPMTFAIAPTPVNTSTVGMVAITAVDVSGPVQYYFENISNSTNSGWITSTRWDSASLTNGVSYDFRVKAKDSKGMETAFSAVSSAAPGNDTTKPTPDPMTFAGPLAVLGENSISMTASPAADINGVQYEFVCTIGGGPGSGWQSSPQFTATALTPGTSYTYIVRAKDTAGNTTSDSAPASATTTAPDTTAPTPGTMNFSTPPAAQGIDSISMTATTASDPSGVQYYFEETTGNPGGDDSIWQDSATYIDTGLQPGTQYTYRVRARDKSPAQTPNNWSLPASATTAVPDTIDPLAITLSPANAASNVPVNTNLVITFDEEIRLGSGLITLKNLTDGTQITIDVQDANADGAVLTINPTANLAYQKSYAIQIAATAIDDLSGNSFAGIENDSTWAFTTTTAPPAGVVFADNFEPTGSGSNATSLLGAGTTANVTTYTVANTSGSVNTTLWVKSASGFNSSRSGLVDESENGGANFTDTTGTQAYAGRYSSNTGISSAAGTIGALTVGTTITITFDAVTDGSITVAPNGNDLNAYLVLYNGGSRSDFTSPLVGTSAVLAQLISSNVTTSSYQTYSFSYTVGNPVIDNNGATTGVATTWLPGLLGQDIGIRFAHRQHAIIDNVSISIVGPGGPGPVASFAISPIASPQTVGTPITGITLTAKDASNNTATGFTGTVTFGGSGGFTGTSANFVLGELSGVSVTPTVAGSNLTFTVNDGASHSGTTTITTIQSQFQAWAAQITDPNLRDRDDDADGDGFNNGQEFLFGTSPIASNGSLTSTEKSGANLILRWKERTSGATYSLLQSNALNNDWTTSGVVPANDGAAVGDYQPRMATVAIGSGKLFFRVRGVEN